ncbi:MAG: helix-turn-helix domain-containing protein [Kistimonas sp.]|nr:helix-turn-helix domain-containing protein [Kistimonas sp.]
MSSQSRQYKQLTLGQRHQIQALFGKGYMLNQIAESVGASPSALSRELGRNSSDKEYCAEAAHTLAVNRRITSRRACKAHERHLPVIKKGCALAGRLKT